IQEHSVPADVIDVLKQQQKPHESAEEILKIKMEQAEKQPESKYTIRSSDKIELAEFDLKQALFDSMHASKSFNKTPKNKTLYHALMESLIKDENVMDQGLADLIKQKKRPHDDADKDEGPTTGSDRGHLFKFDNTDMPMDQGEDLRKTDEQPNDKAVPDNDRYKKSGSDTSPDPEWNEGKLVDERLKKTKRSKISQKPTRNGKDKTKSEDGKLNQSKAGSA
ncbi:hypothetical protein Tco_0068059, partial [Tanacetum coccineum]